MEAPDVSNLLSPAHTLILWNEHSDKWQDHANDHFCHEKRDGSGQWTVAARYDFPDGRSHVDFPDETQAMAFFVNYLYAKHMRSIEKTHIAIPALN